MLIDSVRINTIYANVTEIKKSNVIDMLSKDINNSKTNDFLNKNISLLLTLITFHIDVALTF